MQPPANATVAQGIRLGAPQQLQLTAQPGQGLRATPPRPANLSPTGQHFPAVGNSTINIQPVVQIIQQQNPQMSMQEATKAAVEHIARRQHQQLQQQLAKSSPTQPNQQIRLSPSQANNHSHPAAHQRVPQ